MPETPPLKQYVTVNECNIRHEQLVKDMQENRKINKRLSKLLIGNGEGGLIEKVNRLYYKNQLLNQFFGVFKSILVTLVTLYLAGVLKL